MLSAFDDFPIHQTPDPVLTPATGDNDFYERYWFNGYDRDGDFYLGIGTAVYPHLGIQDAGVSMVIGGHQHAFHVSARADPQRQMTIGPFRLEIVEPMRVCRVVVEAEGNDTGFTCDLTFSARTSALEEPRHHLSRGIKKVMDTTRFTQFGRWSGWVDFDGQRQAINSETTWGTKDRSWGTRGLAGGDRRVAPPDPASSYEGGIFFLWAPVHFDDYCTHYQLFEDHHGRTLFSVGAIVPTYDSPDDLPGIEDPTVQHLRNLTHDLNFETDSRLVASGSLAMEAMGGAPGLVAGDRHEIALEKLFTYRMKGIGYTHPEWGHGQWKGEQEMAFESWSLDDVDDRAFENQHVQHLVRVTWGDRVGIGVLEQLILGSYKPYGLQGPF